MRSKAWICLNIIVITAVSLTACSKPNPTTTPTAIGEEPIYLSIIWHQHQPMYYKDSKTEVYEQPWVRVHAAKDYVDMADMLKNYPNIHVTFNLTPSLISQLDDLSAGAKDMYWVMTEIPADQLNQDQQKFLLDRFFDTNRKIIARFPRYHALLAKRDEGAKYTTQDFLDLQVLFNLAWTDPEWLAQEPLASLVAKGAGFKETDKAVVLNEHLKLINEVVPLHKELQDAGQIELTVTPFDHPILPLLINTDLAKVALPNITLPTQRFAYGQDAVAQIQLGVQSYKDHFGRAPLGMWPAEGAVAQDMVSMVSAAGIKWMASDEGVLAASLGLNSFPRNVKNVVAQPDVLYRPYYVQGLQGNPVAIMFRDQVISDLVGYTYSEFTGSAAAKDFVNRIHAIRDLLIAQGKTGPHLVSVILDGENAWDNYDNDGKDFLNSLYTDLSNDQLIRTVTPSEFLSLAPNQTKIDHLWAGSWINHDFSTWIGEGEENQAWDYLTTARGLLEKYITGIRQTTPGSLQTAQNYIYAAEGSDWFWWFGSDQNSGNDQAFDQQFRDTLKQMYLALNETPPPQLDIPIIQPGAVAADIASSGQISGTVDGLAGQDERELFSRYTNSTYFPQVRLLTCR